jgi:uridine phosphorylase
MKISTTDLILNKDGSVYHLNLLPEDLADDIITVGDPDRVGEVSKHFDKVELRKGKREFITHTGYIGSKRISVISTGIGTDNIDIVLNELDALVNIDLDRRVYLDKLKSLNIIRIGTSGAMQTDIPIDSILVSEYAVGLDALMAFYTYEASREEKAILRAIVSQAPAFKPLKPYVCAASKLLLRKIGKDLPRGITVTAPGFYAPQGRELRFNKSIPNFIKQLSSISKDNWRLTNLEMETSGIYGLANILGHQAISVNAILASRVKYEFSKNPGKTIDKTIKLVLERTCQL